MCRRDDDATVELSSWFMRVPLLANYVVVVVLFAFWLAV